MPSGQKVATAVLEIKTDTSQVKGDLGGLEQAGKKVSQSFQQQTSVMSKGFSDFGSHVRQVQGLVNDFSGQKAIQEAHAVAKAVQEIGGASKLTADQQRSVSAIMSSALQAHKARGDEASASIKNLAAETNKASTASQGFSGWIGKANGMLAAFGAGLSAAAAIGFGKKMLADAGAIEDLHQTVDVSRTALQQLGYIGSEVGLDMQQLGQGIGNLMDRIASGDQKTVTAIGMIGKSVKDLQAAGPLEAFLQVAEGASAIEDPMIKASIAGDLFGDKIGKKLIPMLGDLRTKMQEVPKDALISDQDIEDADRLGDALGHVVTKLEAIAFRAARGIFGSTPGFLKNTGPTIEQQLSQLDYLKRLNLLGADNMPQAGKDVALPPGGKQTLSMTTMLENELKRLRTEAMEPLSAMQKQWIRDLSKWGESETDIAKLVRASGSAVHLYTEQLKKADEAAKKQAEADKKRAAALNDLMSAGTHWYTVLEGLNQRDLEAAKYFLELGRSAEEVATVFGFTKGEVEAITASLKFEQTMVDAAGQSYAQLTKRLEEHTKARLELNNKGFTTNLQAQIAAQKEAAQTLEKVETDSLAKRQSAVQTHFDEMRRQVDQTKAGWQEAMAAIDTAEGAAMDSVARDWSSHLREMEAQTGSFGKMAIGWFGQVQGTLRRAFEGGGGIGGAFKSILSGIGGDIGTDVFGKMAGKLSNTFASKFGVGVTEALGTIIPGIGGIIGSLAGPLMAKLGGLLKQAFGGPSKKELEGREVVKEFESQFANTTDMINKVGEAYRSNGRTAAEAQAAIQRLWAAEKQGAEATKKALEEINELLKRTSEIDDAISGQGFQSQDEIMHAADIANAAYEKMRDSGQYTQEQVEAAYRHYQELLAQLEGAAGEAARAWLKAHKSADEAADASAKAMTDAEKDLKELIDKRDDLTKSIAAEAPEEMMGVIEQQQRQQRDELDKQIQSQADAYAKLAKDTGQEMADAIKEALERLHIKIDIGYNLPPVPTPPSGPGIAPGEPAPGSGTPGGVGPDANATPEAAGDWLRVTRPRTFLVGEAGPEDVAFGGAGRDLARDVAGALAPLIASGRAAGYDTIVTKVVIGDREVARAYHRVLDHNVDGIKTEAQELLGVR